MAFWGVFAAGLVGCTVLGIGPVLKLVGGSWASPPMIVGSVLGVAILGLAVAFAMGVRPAFLPSDSAMMVALVGAKVAVGLMAFAGVFGRA
jgi:hypothetical protein